MEDKIKGITDAVLGLPEEEQNHLLSNLVNIIRDVREKRLAGLEQELDRTRENIRVLNRSINPDQGLAMKNPDGVSKSHNEHW